MRFVILAYGPDWIQVAAADRIETLRLVSHAPRDAQIPMQSAIP